MSAFFLCRCARSFPGTTTHDRGGGAVPFNPPEFAAPKSPPASLHCTLIELLPFQQCHVRPLFTRVSTESVPEYFLCADPTTCACSAQGTQGCPICHSWSVSPHSLHSFLETITDGGNHGKFMLQGRKASALDISSLCGGTQAFYTAIDS